MLKLLKQCGKMRGSGRIMNRGRQNVSSKEKDIGYFCLSASVQKLEAKIYPQV